jgi:hypothetical protein
VYIRLAAGGSSSSLMTDLNIINVLELSGDVVADVCGLQVATSEAIITIIMTIIIIIVIIIIIIIMIIIITTIIINIIIITIITIIAFSHISH